MILAHFVSNASKKDNKLYVNILNKHSNNYNNKSPT